MLKKHEIPYEKEAERVKNLKEKFPSFYFPVPLMETHHYTFFRLPPLPSHVKHLALIGYNQVAVTKEKILKNAKELKNESGSLIWHTYQSHLFESASDLKQHSFHGYKMKEYRLAARKLKGLNQKEESKKYRATLYHQKDQPLSSHETWQEMLKAQEERHFQLTRIIKYLVD